MPPAACEQLRREAAHLDEWRMVLRDLGTETQSRNLTNLQEYIQTQNLDKILWLTGRHRICGVTISYFGLVPRDIIGIIMDYLRIVFTRDDRTYRTLLGLRDSPGDEPAVETPMAREWYRLDRRHREGAPANVFVTRDACSMYWYREGHSCNPEGSPVVTYMYAEDYFIVDGLCVSHPTLIAYYRKLLALHAFFSSKK